MSLKICLDPGHSINYNKGVIEGYYESNMNFTLANYLKEELEKYKDIQVILTKNKQNEDPSLSKRGQIAVDNKCDLFISLHSDAATASAKGITVFRSLKRNDSKALGDSLGQAIVSVMKENGVSYFRNGGSITKLYPNTSNTDYYGVIRSAVKGSSVKYAYLIEHGFHTNPVECTWLSNNDNIRKLAIAEASAIAKYFNLTLKDNSLPTPPPQNNPVVKGCPYNEPARQLHKGDKGEDVKWIQWYLCDNGYKVSIDGSFGPDCDKKVKQFQTDQNIKNNGWVGPQTIDRLKNPKSKKTNPYKEPSQQLHKGDKGTGVKWLQWALSENNYSLKVDGSFGPATDRAVRDFQKRNNLKVDGWVGPATKQKLKAR